MKKIYFNTFTISLLLVVLFVSTILFQCTNKAFMQYEFAKLDTVNTLKIDDESLDLIIDNLYDYFNRGAKLDISVKINGEIKLFYNTKEITHMDDVLNLYKAFSNFRNIGFLIILVFIIFSVYYYKSTIKDFFKAFKKAILILCIVLILLVLYIVIDFHGFWLNFHYLLFDNELFFLDPRVDNLINLVPSQFFIDLIFFIIISYLFLLLLIYLVFKILTRRKDDSHRIIST